MGRMDLKSMKGLKTLKNDQAKLTQLQNELDPNSLKQVEDVVSQYYGKDENELFGELSRISREQREAGNLNDSQIDNIVSTIAPMLNEEQRDRLLSITKTLKEQ